MCTATYIKDNKGRIIFTTNRDENAARPTSPPEIHLVDGMRLLFPQDRLAGGTWIAVGESGQISCVLIRRVMDQTRLPMVMAICPALARGAAAEVVRQIFLATRSLLIPVPPTGPPIKSIHKVNARKCENIYR